MLSFLVQALSSMLQPQSEMLQVKPAVTEDMADEAKENIQTEATSPGKKPAQPEVGAVDQRVSLDPVALQQVLLQSGALEIILDAVKAAGMATPQGMCFAGSKLHLCPKQAARILGLTVPSASCLHFRDAC